MIVSASRRTDIPAFYSKWLMNRVKAGYCTVPNPFNKTQVTTVSLDPSDVDAIVFWSRNPRPMFKYLDHLLDCGFRYYFQFTLLSYPNILEPNRRSLDSSILEFKELSRIIGPERVIWRYDPVIVTSVMDANFHLETFGYIANELEGYTKRVIVSLVDIYRKNQKRLKLIASQIGALPRYEHDIDPELQQLFHILFKLGSSFGMEVLSCAEKSILGESGIKPGKCIDDILIKNVLDVSVQDKKDHGQRELCRCVTSRDIGMYDTCSFGCVYCYATGSPENVQKNRKLHYPESPSMLGWFE